MPPASRDDDLEARVAALETAIEDLRDDLLEENTMSRELFSPPSLRDILRFTDQIAIPGIILILETNIRLLKLLQRTIRLSDTSATSDGSSEIQTELATYTSKTLRELETAISKLQSLDIAGGPADETAQSLLTDIRELRTDITNELNEASTNAPPTSNQNADELTNEIAEELEDLKHELDERQNHDPSEDDN